MKKVLDLISQEVMNAFESCGYDASYGKVGISNRPDLCEFQCNGAMAGAKKYKKAPVMIANDVVAKLQESPLFAEVAAVNPGFINIRISGDYLAGYLKEMQAGLFFYKAGLACAAEHLDEMHLLTLVHHIDDFVRIKQLAALDDGRKVGRRIKRSSVGFQNDARRHFLRVRILCDIHDQCALIHVRIAFFFHFFYHLRYIRLRVRLFFPEIKLYVQISVVLLQVRDRNI